MIYVYPMGGLGNLLFQIASVYSLALDNNDDFAILEQPNIGRGYSGEDITKYKDNILQDFKFVSSLDHSVKSKNHDAIYQPNTIYRGYFQNESYFDHHRALIIDTFKLPKIEVPFDEYVSVHVRRTDYVRPGNKNEALSVDYYTRAMERFQNAKFVFVSDDHDWVRANFPDQYIYNGKSVLEDLALMANAKYHIMANSSFSWWGSYLADSYLSIAPDPWFVPDTPASSIITSRTAIIPR